MRFQGDRVNGSLHNIRDEIASLRSQISRGIDSLATRQPDSSARDMEELADYFSQRLAKCQKQVYNVVNQVQSQVGDMDPSMPGTFQQQSQMQSQVNIIIIKLPITRDLYFSFLFSLNSDFPIE